MYAFLLVSHVGMVVQAFLIHRYSDFPGRTILVAVLWYGPNDLVDCFVSIVGTPHHTLLPVEPIVNRTVQHVSPVHEIAATGAVALTIPVTRKMYKQAVDRLSEEIAETEEFFRAVIVAIDTTETDPFTGNRTDHEDEIIGTKENTDQYAYQWATVQSVGNAVPIVLDAHPVRGGETRLEIVEDLLNSADDPVTSITYWWTGSSTAGTSRR